MAKPPSRARGQAADALPPSRARGQAAAVLPLTSSLLREQVAGFAGFFIAGFAGFLITGCERPTAGVQRGLTNSQISVVCWISSFARTMRMSHAAPRPDPLLAYWGLSSAETRGRLCDTAPAADDAAVEEETATASSPSSVL